ncbi:MAG: hypothetical protein AAF211_11710 [Myxococcota bacterium]
MPEATQAPWYFDVILLVGAFSAATYGLMVLFRPRLTRPSEPDDAPGEE